MEQFGAGSRPEGVQAFTELLLDLLQVPGATLGHAHDVPCRGIGLGTEDGSKVLDLPRQITGRACLRLLVDR